jgi:hypothetical protein
VREVDPGHAAGRSARPAATNTTTAAAPERSVALPSRLLLLLLQMELLELRRKLLLLLLLLLLEKELLPLLLQHEPLLLLLLQLLLPPRLHRAHSTHRVVLPHAILLHIRQVGAQRRGAEHLRLHFRNVRRRPALRRAVVETAAYGEEHALAAALRVLGLEADIQGGLDVVWGGRGREKR